MGYEKLYTANIEVIKLRFAKLQKSEEETEEIQSKKLVKGWEDIKRVF